MSPRYVSSDVNVIAVILLLYYIGMDLVLIGLVLVHSSAIALGVGASTIAIAGFLTAIADNTFDESERRIMGVVYFSLRVAMALIVLFSLLIMWLHPDFFGWFTVPLWIMTAVLFLNAFLMTKHWISTKLGPAIQAGTWYTLGFIITIYVFKLSVLTLMEFIYFFIIDLVLAIAIVNGCIQYLSWRRKKADGQM